MDPYSGNTLVSQSPLSSLDCGNGDVDMVGRLHLMLLNLLFQGEALLANLFFNEICFSQ